MRNLELNVALNRRCVRSDNEPSINECRRRAAHVELSRIRHAGIYGVGSFLGREAGLERRLVQTGLAGEVHGLVPRIRSRDEVLSLVEAVVELPERLGALLVGAASSQRGGFGPRMNLLDGTNFKAKPLL